MGVQLCPTLCHALALKPPVSLGGESPSPSCLHGLLILVFSVLSLGKLSHFQLPSCPNPLNSMSIEFNEQLKFCSHRAFLFYGFLVSFC